MVAAKVNPGQAGGKFRRRKFRVIDPMFQWKYAIILGTAVFVLCWIMSTVLYGVLQSQARQRITNPGGYVAPVHSVIIGFSCLFSAVSAGAIALWALAITHRICGPMVVFHRYLTDLKDGRFPFVRALRKNDEFKELHRSFAGAIESLQQTKTREYETYSELLKLLNDSRMDQSSRDAMLRQVRDGIQGLKAKAGQSLGMTQEKAGESMSPGRESPAVSSAMRTRDCESRSMEMAAH